MDFSTKRVSMAATWAAALSPLGLSFPCFISTVRLLCQQWGTVTTNDGSEENPGAMGGGQGGMGGKMGGGCQNSTTPPSSTAP